MLVVVAAVARDADDDDDDDARGCCCNCWLGGGSDDDDDPMFRAAKRDAVAALRSMDAARCATGAGGVGGGAFASASRRDLSTETSRSFIVARSLSFGNQIPRIVAGPFCSCCPCPPGVFVS